MSDTNERSAEYWSLVNRLKRASPKPAPGCEGNLHWEAAEKIERLEAELASLREERAKLESAIRWALGEEGDFAERPAGAGAYWWRTELRSRSALTRSNGEG